jgi:hypothetical protein
MNNRYLFEFVFGTLLEEDKYYPEIKRLLGRLEKNGYRPTAENSQPWILCGLLNNWIQGSFERKWKQYVDEEAKSILDRLKDDYRDYERFMEKKESEDDSLVKQDCEPLFFDI